MNIKCESGLWWINVLQAWKYYDSLNPCTFLISRTLTTETEELGEMIHKAEWFSGTQNCDQLWIKTIQILAQVHSPQWNEQWQEIYNVCIEYEMLSVD